MVTVQDREVYAGARDLQARAEAMQRLG